MLKPYLIPFVVIAFTNAFWSTTNIDAADLPGRLRLGKYEMTLNGSGARHKNFLQLYVGGLYLEQRSSEPASIVAADDPMGIRIEITSMFVSQARFVASLNQGFQNSTNGNLGPIREQIDQFRQCFVDKIKKGDIIDIVYLPSQGVIVRKNGRVKGVIKGLAFKRALFGIWLSDKPADEGLKRAMLAST